MPCALGLLSGALGGLGGLGGLAGAAEAGAGAGAGGAMADAVLPDEPIDFSDVKGPSSMKDGLNWWQWREKLFTDDEGNMKYVPMPRSSASPLSQGGPAPQMNWQPQTWQRPMDAGEASLRRAAGIPASDASGNWL